MKSIGHVLRAFAAHWRPLLIGVILFLLAGLLFHLAATHTHAQNNSPSAAQYTHVVQPGENLWTIARDHGVGWESVYSINSFQVGWGDWSPVGKRLLLPTPYVFPLIGWNGHVGSHWGAGVMGACDIAANSGTPIVASIGGRVNIAGWGNGVGNWVEIEGPDGLKWHYFHMREQPWVRAGQWVYTGQRIGSVGSTGFSTGPHLHFTYGWDFDWGYGATSGTNTNGINTVNWCNTQLQLTGMGW